MSRFMPFEDTWPGVNPIGTIDPGGDHLDSHVKTLVDANAYMCIYDGKCHFSQAFPTKPSTGYSMIRALTDSYEVCAEYLCIPRQYMTSLIFTFFAGSTPGGDGGSIKFEAYTDGDVLIDDVEVAIPDGAPADGISTALVINMPETLVRLTISLKSTTTTDATELFSVSGYDYPLTKAEWEDIGVGH